MYIYSLISAPADKLPPGCFPLGFGMGRRREMLAPVLLDRPAVSPSTLHPTPYTLHPTPYTLRPTPYALHPTPHTLHPAPCTLHSALHPPARAASSPPSSFSTRGITLHPSHAPG